MAFTAPINIHYTHNHSTHFSGCLLLIFIQTGRKMVKIENNLIYVFIWCMPSIAPIFMKTQLLNGIMWRCGDLHRIFPTWNENCRKYKFHLHPHRQYALHWTDLLKPHNCSTALHTDLRVPNFIQPIKKYGNYRYKSTVPIFIKLTLILQLFIKKAATEFHENPFFGST
jgi:hypothetical protein